MRFASHLARGEQLPIVVAEACDAIAAKVAAPTVLFPFLRAADPNDYRKLPALLNERFPGAVIFGCSAGGVIGGGHEEEDGPALALTAAALPGTCTLTHLPSSLGDAGEGRLDPAALRERIGGSGDLMVLLDPFSMEPDALIAALDEALPGVVKLGALASGGPAPKSSMLFGNIGHRTGALVLRTGDAVRLRPLVAQGCRPIGRPHVVTRVDEHAIAELDGKPALEALQALFQSLVGDDREIFRHSLFVGLEMDKSSVEVRTDRLLVRNLLGVDPQKKSIGVAALLKTYDVLHFVLRDSASAELELGTLLDAAKQEGAAPLGALIFSCMGRGRHLFGRADHDPQQFQARFGDVPIGGFFANGEIAPVGGKTFLHGYTSAFAMFEPRSSA